MKFSCQPAYINIEGGLIYYPRLKLAYEPIMTGVKLLTESEAVESQLKDIKKIIEQAEKIKKALELHKSNMNQNKLF
ncbi:hypothetical protein [Massilibacteroides sp.]|uniref:hypothetical protein n=1 Tax=Massilibacteroides sp. TaxID=2034766 RepID=UPI00262C7DEA|nr:hypothetical protein [Massilibacteroides sp.]MDD4515667.1 hypothetical protein [Massilibacteroides sp.]